MDIQAGIALIQESLVLILVFLALLAYSMVRGRYALVSLILGLYLALLISLKFPYYDKLLEWTAGEQADIAALIGSFALFTAVATFLFERLLERDFFDSAFDGFWKKMLLALCAAVLVMAYSYHVLPITNIIDPGEPAGVLFSAKQNFFWWLLVPLIGLLIV